MIDGNPNTAWTSGYSQPGRGNFGGLGRRGATTTAPVVELEPTEYPHMFTVTFDKPVAMHGLLLMNRQNNRQREGDICDYEVQISNDGQQWQTISQGKLKSTWNPSRTSTISGALWRV